MDSLPNLTNASELLNLNRTIIGNSESLYSFDLKWVQVSDPNINQVLWVQLILNPTQVLLLKLLVQTHGMTNWHPVEVLRRRILEVIQVCMGINENHSQIILMDFQLALDGSESQRVISSDSQRNLFFLLGHHYFFSQKFITVRISLKSVRKLILRLNHITLVLGLNPQILKTF